MIFDKYARNIIAIWQRKCMFWKRQIIGIVLHLRKSLQWRHNEWHGIINHRYRDCLHNRLFRLISKKTSNPALLAICEGNPPVIIGFPSQRARKAGSASMPWRHHVPPECWYDHQFWIILYRKWYLNTLKPRQNGRRSQTTLSNALQDMQYKIW